MLQNLINQLCQNTSIDLAEFQARLATSATTLSDLLNYQNKQTGDNLLIYASRVGNLNLIKILNNTSNKTRVKLNFTNRDGKNALHEACQNSHLECVKYLLETDEIDVNALRKGDWYEYFGDSFL